MTRVSRFRPLLLTTISLNCLIALSACQSTREFVGLDDPRPGATVSGERHPPAMNTKYMSYQAVPAVPVEIRPIGQPSQEQPPMVTANSQPARAPEYTPPPSQPQQEVGFFDRLAGAGEDPDAAPASAAPAAMAPSARKPLPENAGAAADAAPVYVSPAAAAPAPVSVTDSSNPPIIRWNGGSPSALRDKPVSQTTQPVVTAQAQQEAPKPQPASAPVEIAQNAPPASDSMYDAPIDDAAPPKLVYQESANNKAERPVKKRGFFSRLFGSSDEPDPQSAADSAAAEQSGYPALSAVPERPAEFSSVQQTHEQKMEELKDERTMATSARQQVEADVAAEAPATIQPSAPAFAPTQPAPLVTRAAPAPAPVQQQSLSEPPIVRWNGNANVQQPAPAYVPPAPQPQAAPASSAPVNPVVTQDVPPPSNITPAAPTTQEGLPSPDILEKVKVLPPSRYSAREQSIQSGQ